MKDICSLFLGNKDIPLVDDLNSSFDICGIFVKSSVPFTYDGVFLSDNDGNILADLNDVYLMEEL